MRGRPDCSLSVRSRLRPCVGVISARSRVAHQDLRLLCAIARGRSVVVRLVLVRLCLACVALDILGSALNVAGPPSRILETLDVSGLAKGHRATVHHIHGEPLFFVFGLQC